MAIGGCVHQPQVPDCSSAPHDSRCQMAKEEKVWLYEKLKQEGEKLGNVTVPGEFMEKAFAEITEEEREYIRQINPYVMLGKFSACVDANRACVEKARDDREKLVHGSDIEKCVYAPDDNEDYRDCQDRILISRGRIAELIHAQLLNNRCAANVAECFRNKMRQEVEKLQPEEEEGDSVEENEE